MTFNDRLIKHWKEDNDVLFTRWFIILFYTVFGSKYTIAMQNKTRSVRFCMLMYSEIEILKECRNFNFTKYPTRCVSGNQLKSLYILFNRCFILVQMRSMYTFTCYTIEILVMKWGKVRSVDFHIIIMLKSGNMIQKSLGLVLYWLWSFYDITSPFPK